MKVSVVTIVYNGVEYLEACIASVIAQDYPDIEYILIDGASSDGTLAIANRYLDQFAYFISEPDLGIYDAFNKGIARSTGDIVGMLNADDRYSGTGVISTIVSHFEKTKCKAVYGNLSLVSSGGQLFRYWQSKAFDRNRFRFGWMPAHPTLYIKRDLFQSYGTYSLNYSTCSDYEFILRLFYINQVPAEFIDLEFVVMRAGGRSNGSVLKIYRGLINDFRILRFHRLPFPLVILFCKRLRKIPQFF